MNNYVANVLAKKLYSLNFLHLVGGMVFTLIKTDSIENVENPEAAPRTVTMRLPYTADYHYREGVQCGSEPVGKLIEMVPDANLAGLCYFEDRGSSPFTNSRGRYNMNGSMRFVAWLNNQLIDMDPLQLETAAMVQVLNAWGHQPITDRLVSNLTFIQKQVVQKSARIFSEYTYDEAKTQYLMPPYVYFALDISFQYIVGEQCPAIPTTKQLSCT